MSDDGRDFWDAAITMTAAAQALHVPSAITSPYDVNNPLDLTVFISCFNEEATIADTLSTVAEAMAIVGKSYEIIVIDDASKDRSASVARGFIDKHPALNIVLRANKKRKGLAQNYADGAFIGRGAYYRLLHGSNDEPVETMVDIFKTVGEADIVVPYYISARERNLYRRLAVAAYTGFINLISGHRINYYSGTHIHLRYNVMRWHSNSLGFSFQTDLLCRLLDLGFTCKQVPCRMAPRRSPSHGITWKNALSVMHTIFDIVLRRVSNKLHNMR